MPFLSTSLAWEALVAFGSSSVAIVAVAYFSRSIVHQLLSKDVERFKAELIQNNEREIERFRNELQLKLLEHQVRYSKLHEKVFETVAELYSKLVKTHVAMANFIKPLVLAGEKAEVERGKEAAQAWSQCVTFFNQNRIFFKEPICHLVDTYIEEMRKLHIDFQYKKHSQHPTRQWDSLWDKLGKDITQIKRMLEKYFRAEIGLNESQKSERN